MASVTPPSSYVQPTQAAASSPPVDGDAVQADVENLPQTLQNNNRDLSLRGTVAGTNDDGTTRINTPRGPVDVQLPQPLPAKGTDVQVDIPAGNPPRTVTVTLPPAQTQTPTPPSVPVPETPSVPIPQLPTGTQQGAPTPSMPAPSTGQAPATQTPAQPTVPQTPTPSGVVVQPGPQSQLQVPQATVPTSIPVPSDAPVPSPQQALPSGIVLLQEAADAGVNPQHLLDFLKTSLQTFLKTPALPQQQTGNTLGVGLSTPNMAGAAQRPLQIGQLVRLIPLAAGQVSTQSSITQNNAVPVPGTAGSITTPATPGVVVPRGITLPTTQQTLSGQTAPSMPTIPRGTPQPQPGVTPGITVNTVPRGMMPISAGPATPALSGQMTLATPGTVLPQSVGTGQQQFIIAAPAGQNTHIIPAQQIDVRINAVLPAASAQVLQNPDIANLVHGSPSTPVLFAQVTGQTAQGLPVVELPTFTLAADGTLKTSSTMMVLQFPARGLAPSTILKLDVLPGTQMTTTTISAAAQNAQAITWEALDDILHNTPAQPQNAQMAALQAAMPKPGATAFTAPVLMFMAALRGGDIGAWMGEKGLDAIRSSRSLNALARVSGDFAATARHLNDDDAKPAGDWKSLNLPMTFGGELNRIQLHYRSFDQEPDNTAAKDKKTGTRFIMDLNLTRMGPMQIDGFSLGKKLDVTLRSEKSLSPSMRDAMRARYHDAVSSIGFAGEMNFSADATHKTWIDLDEHRGLAKPAIA